MHGLHEGQACEPSLAAGAEKMMVAFAGAFFKAIKLVASSWTPFSTGFAGLKIIRGSGSRRLFLKLLRKILSCAGLSSWMGITKASSAGGVHS